MPSSVGGNGGSRDSSSRSCDSMSSSQRSNSISNSNNTNSSRSSQSNQSQGNLAGMNVSRSNSPKESPAAQAARCNTAQNRGNMNGMSVAKSTTPKETPAMQAAQAARCNPARSSSTQASNTVNTTTNNTTNAANQTTNTTNAAKTANTQQAAKQAATKQAAQATANLGNLSVAKTATETESPVSKTATTDAKATEVVNTTPNAAAINAAATPANQTHTVKAGETLSGIAAKANTTVKDIVAANPEITNPNKISVGQQINVPSAAKATEVDALATTPTAVEAIAAKTNTPVNGLTVQQLRAIVPNLPLAKAQEYLPHLNAALAEFNINTPARQAAFVAQLAHESVGLTAFEEFASGRAYEGRRDLGNVKPGDGVLYKGRGPIQLTGRANYREVGKALGVDLENNPKLASRPEVGFRVAGQFWEKNGLNKLADARKFDSITKRVNGGFNGKADRDRYYARAKNVLGV